MVSRPSRPHLPMRPLWMCRACGQPWPCGPARLSLLAEFKGERTALILYLSGQLAEARDQLAQLGGVGSPADLTDRFISWARARG